MMYQFTVSNMTCQGCAAAVTRAISTLDEYAQIKTFPAVRRLQVETFISKEQLIIALENAGYHAELEEASS